MGEEIFMMEFVFLTPGHKYWTCLLSLSWTQEFQEYGVDFLTYDPIASSHGNQFLKNWLRKTQIWLILNNPLLSLIPVASNGIYYFQSYYLLWHRVGGDGAVLSITLYDTAIHQYKIISRRRIFHCIWLESLKSYIFRVKNWD